jgi:hypothetical protein
MSDVYPLINGWVGYGSGAEILLRDDEPIDPEHPLVKERPELFTSPPPSEPEPGRRSPGRLTPSRNKPKPAAGNESIDG